MKKKHKGSMSLISSLLPFVIILPVLLAVLYVSTIQSFKESVQDDMVLSALASAVMDSRAYAETQEIVLSDPEGAYVRFQNCLRENLRLNASLYPVDHALLGGEVEILSFVLYNRYRDGTIQKYDAVHAGGRWITLDRGLDQPLKGCQMIDTASEDKKVQIKKTGVFVCIRFPLNTFFHQQIPAEVYSFVAIDPF